MKTYKIYGLIDPRTYQICYIGYSTQKLKNRLAQHNNPHTENMSKIAKLCRSLKVLNKKFEIVEITTCLSEEDMYEKEIFYIKEYKQLGYKLYNLQDGGKLTTNPPESRKRGAEKKKLKPSPLLGDNNPCSVLKESDVLNIYSLIKKNYTNLEIFEIYKEKCKISTIKALRNGQNWKHLWSGYFDQPIKSLKNEQTGYKARIKLKIVDLIEKGYSIEHIHKHFPNLKNSDLKRIKDKKIWVPVWNIHNFNKRS